MTSGTQLRAYAQKRRKSLSSPRRLTLLFSVDTFAHARYLHLVVHVLLLIKLALILSGGILVLLVLRDEIVHVGLSLSEFHLIHALTGVPMEEGLAAEHSSELLADTLEHLLDGGGVSEEGDSHLEALGWDIAHAGLDVVGDPLNEVGRVLVLDVEHLLVNLLGGHTATEES